MLVELALLASCNVAGVALGSCNSSCPAQGSNSYTICAIEQQTTTTKKPTNAKPVPKPKRLCSYYVNGTVDVPTASVITAWVEVGSRLCIGDQIPAPVTPKPKTVAEEISDAFTAFATAPFAYVSPSTEVEIGEVAYFGVNPGGGNHQGELFGKRADVRFVPSGYSWEFSDGQRSRSQNPAVSFADPQELRAVVEVSYRIDYRYPGQAWVLGASSLSLGSNQVSLSVIDPPRRTLLRD